MAHLVHHVHGKKRVRLARTWREGDVHHFVEWTVEVIIESDMEHAYKTPSNEGMTATDTTKNQCYVVAQKMSHRAHPLPSRYVAPLDHRANVQVPLHRCSPEEYVVALGRQFIDSYPLISAVEVRLEEKPWSRTEVSGRPHDHGYSMQGPCVRTAQAVVPRHGPAQVTSGMSEFRVLKTTQSGYEGFLKDKHTGLKDTRERILGTSMDVQWTYGAGTVTSYDAVYARVMETLKELFFGPPNGGVYSPSVQYTLYQMGAAVVERVDEVAQITISAPNIHFIPAATIPGMKFNDDVYIATSEPHGQISATVSKDKRFKAISKL